MQGRQGATAGTALTVQSQPNTAQSQHFLNQQIPVQRQVIQSQQIPHQGQAIQSEPISTYNQRVQSQPIPIYNQSNQGQSEHNQAVIQIATPNTWDDSQYLV